MPPKQNKHYPQKYRKSWESMALFKEWLKPLPNDITKAYCSVCNNIIKAHLCDLRKHGSSIKHKRAIKLVNKLKNMDSSEIPGEEYIEVESHDQEEFDDEEYQGVRWSREAVENLLKHVKAKWLQLHNKTKKKKDVFEDIASDMAMDGFDVTGMECSRKFTNLRFVYLSLFEKILSGEKANTNLFYFDALNELLRDDPDAIAYLEKIREVKTQESDSSLNDSLNVESSDLGESHWDSKAVMNFLSSLLEFKDFFSDKDDDENMDTVWLAVSQQMQVEGYNFSMLSCHLKWKFLLAEYENLKAESEITGALPSWPYYAKVQEVVTTVPMFLVDHSDHAASKNVRKTSVKSHRGSQSSTCPAQLDSFLQDENVSKVTESTIDANEKIRPIDASGFTFSDIQRISDTAAVWQRLSVVENRLDEMDNYDEIQTQTNSLLSQILSEICILSNRLLPVDSYSSSSVGSSRLRDENITIVVPHSE